jgi:PhzF family phenazine biosynthesis protein
MQIYQVDAFAEELFQGNPAAVIPLEQWLPDTLLQHIAMENNLADTAFFVPEGQGYSIRWFTPATEVALCGHATLAAAYVLFGHLGYDRDIITFHTRSSGDLQVSKAGGGALTLNFPATVAQPVTSSPADPTPTAPSPTAPTPASAVFDGLQIPARDLYKGPFDYMVVLDDQQAVEALKPDFKRLAAVPARGVVVTAPGKESDFVSRCFFPQSGIDEDPATGSAHSMLAPYWAARLGKQRLSAIQLSARRGWLDCELKGDRVLITGHAKAFLKGEILLETTGDGTASAPDTAPSAPDTARSAPDTPPQPLSIRKAQDLVDTWIRTTGVRYFSELTNMAILTEEVGEVARLMSRLYGDQSFKDSDTNKNLADELADVLWVLICIANQTGVDLTTALGENFIKKNIRDAVRHKTNAKLTEP